MDKFIKIIGAKQHNLKNVSLSIPKKSLVVVTGPSGSGKSSLVFDTLYAEGQRRYIESLSSYARQFLDILPKPDVEKIEGLSPSIAIQQKSVSHNPRSTVGTVTEIYDYLRVLFARIGVPHSPATNLPIVSQNQQQIANQILQLPQNSKIMILAPIAKNAKGSFVQELKDFINRGVSKFLIDNKLVDREQILDKHGTWELEKKNKHCIFAIVDRLIIDELDEHMGGDMLKTRVFESVGTALDWGKGVLEVKVMDDEGKPLRDICFSSLFSCPVSGFSLAEIEPRLFSFNSKIGACSKCDGIGEVNQFDVTLIASDPKKDLLKYTWPHSMRSFVEIYRKEYNAKTLEDYTPEMIDRLQNLGLTFLGEESPYHRVLKCPSCHGARLNEKALCVKINNLNLGQLCNLSMDDLFDFFVNLQLNSQQEKIAKPLLHEIVSRIKFLLNVGLNYIGLSRNSSTLSGGESQRIRLASQIGSGLTGVTYVLDEPSIGLHQCDNNKLIETLKNLRDMDNNIVVVEHDMDTIMCADYIVDMGQGAGYLGGEITACGNLEQIKNTPHSLTGQYLTGSKFISVPTKRRSFSKTLDLINAHTNNLKNITVSFPLNVLCVVTGVSGGGKSSLVMQTLLPLLSKCLNNKITMSQGEGKTYIKGYEEIVKVIHMDQNPIGRTSRSNPATYIGVFDSIREAFAMLPESKNRGLTPSEFSFNVDGGRCTACKGDGVKKISMLFLSDVLVNCDICQGKRYNMEVLQVKYKDHSIYDVLSLTVDEAAQLFANNHKILKFLEVLQSVGMGYIKLGQSSSTLSGGEAQRIKIAKEFVKPVNNNAFYILDEPTTGLHLDDIDKLLRVLQTLVNKGNTVLVIEHNLELIKVADYLIDLGPCGGIGGGYVNFCGTPEQIVQIDNLTGKYLKPLLI